MKGSAYTVTSALSVACEDCEAPIGKPCRLIDGRETKRSHSARRAAADAKRTAEVYAKEPHHEP